ncbi:MAG TPA: hypothetical protein VIE64_04405 [Solirubrobacterales bacterium]
MTRLKDLNLCQKRLLAATLLALAILVVGVSAWQASSNEPGSETHFSEAEEEAIEEELDEEIGEEFGDPTNPQEPRDLEEMIIKQPGDEWATTKQLERQILTNVEVSDPTHAHEVSCSYGSSYRSYMHYLCTGFSLEGQGGAATLEITVDTSTGLVEVEPVY